MTTSTSSSAPSDPGSGATPTGTTHNGATRNGATHNGTTHNGTTHNGTTHNGATRNGTSENEMTALSTGSLLGAPAWRLADAFDRAAPSYDAMVALSPGYYDQLRRSAQALMARATLPVDRPMRVADLGCGSGASTAALLEAASEAGATDPVVTGVDASAGMLAEAARKPWPDAVGFVESDALSWLQAQPAASLDAVLAAYLLRNVTERDAIVAELARVLVAGGAVALQDYSVAGRPLAGALWAGVCHVVIIPLAVINRSDVPLHRYLYRSVRDFDSVEVLHDRLTRAGLTDPQHLRHSGWQRSMVHTLTAVAP